MKKALMVMLACAVTCGTVWATCCTVNKKATTVPEEYGAGQYINKLLETADAPDATRESEYPESMTKDGEMYCLYSYSYTPEHGECKGESNPGTHCEQQGSYSVQLYGEGNMYADLSCSAPFLTNTDGPYGNCVTIMCPN